MTCDCRQRKMSAIARLQSLGMALPDWAKTVNPDSGAILFPNCPQPACGRPLEWQYMGVSDGIGHERPDLSHHYATCICGTGYEIGALIGPELEAPTERADESQPDLFTVGI